jgi:hypothetical protein
MVLWSNDCNNILLCDLSLEKKIMKYFFMGAVLTFLFFIDINVEKIHKDLKNMECLK